MKCSVSYCWENTRSKGMCKHHYNQSYERKDARRSSRRADLARRLAAKGFDVSEQYLEQRMAGMR